MKSLKLLLLTLVITLGIIVPASADIFKIEGPGSCPGNIGAGLCNGSVPFSLSLFLNGSLTLNINVPVLGGTEEWVFINDTGHAVTDLSFIFNGSYANNASCQIANSHGATVTNWFNACSIVPICARVAPRSMA